MKNNQRKENLSTPSKIKLIALAFLSKKIIIILRRQKDQVLLNRRFEDETINLKTTISNSLKKIVVLKLRGEESQKRLKMKNSK